MNKTGHFRCAHYWTFQKVCTLRGILEGVRISTNSTTERKLLSGGGMLHVQGTLVAVHTHSLGTINKELFSFLIDNMTGCPNDFSFFFLISIKIVDFVLTLRCTQSSRKTVAPSLLTFGATGHRGSSDNLVKHLRFFFFGYVYLSSRELT